MKKYFYQNVLLGIRVRNFKAGRLSITDEYEPLQALAMMQEKGVKVAPHRHKSVKRITASLQECLVVIDGKIRVDLFGSGRQVLKKVTLLPGDLFITVSGGHAVTFLDKSKVFEIKNGPFEKDRIEI